MERRKKTAKMKTRDLVTLNSVFTDIANAIRQKSGTSATMTPSEMPQKILDIPSGGESDVDLNKPIKFRDCDGVILHSYTVDEVESMTELPSMPTKSGLTCQGWNWTLQQVKDYAATYGKCEVGATYTTDDGKTRIKLTIQDPKYTTIPIVFQQTVANGVKVNWGDGFEDQTYSGTSQQTISHTYTPSAYPATYTITFEVTSGTMSFPSYIMGMSSRNTTSPRDAFLNMIDEVNIGNGVTSIGDYAFYYCCSLSYVTIPDRVTSIGQAAFQSCFSLASITIPSSVTSIGAYVFSGDYGIKTFDFRRSTSVPTLSNVNAFANTPTVKEIVVPDNLYDTWIAATNWNSSTNQISTSIIKASESSLGTL